MTSINALVDHIEDRVTEITAQSDIAYTPSGFTPVVAPVLQKLSKKRRRWPVRLVRNAKTQECAFCFGGDLKVRVPAALLREFAGRLGIKPGEPLGDVVVVNLGETTEVDADDAVETVEDEFHGLFRDGVVAEAYEDVREFRRVFDGLYTAVPQRGFALQAGSTEDFHRSLLTVMTAVKQAYGDKGNIEMIAEAIRNRTPLTAFDVFKSWPQGLMSFHADVEKLFSYDWHVGYDYRSSQKVTVNNAGILEDLEDMPSDCKVVGRDVFAVKTFTAVFEKLRSEIRGRR